MLNFWNNKKMSQSQLVASHKNKKEAFSMEKPVKDLIDNISTLLKQQVPKGQGDLAFDFVHQFYTNPSKENLTRMGEEELVEGLADMWSFFHQRNVGEPKVRVYHWKPKGNKALAERVVIDIVNNNRSFMLDSLHGLLQRLGTKARLTFHPIISVERDQKGEVVSLSGPQDLKDGQHLESIIHCEIVDHISPELIAELEVSIPEMLRDVKRANEDWKPMRAKALETVRELESYR